MNQLQNHKKTLQTPQIIRLVLALSAIASAICLLISAPCAQAYQEGYWTKYDNTIPANADSGVASTNGKIPRGNSGRGDVHANAPRVIKDGADYKMWYMGHDGANYRIYYATSSNGLEWIKYDNTIPANADSGVASTNGKIPLGNSGRGDDYYIFGASVIKDGADYKMWYAGSDGATYRIYYATSSNGLEWTKLDNTIPANADSGVASTNGKIPLGTGGRGDDAHVYDPNVIKDGADYKMWYTGHDGANARIYYATSSNGLEWIKYDNLIPTNSDGGSTNGKIPLGTSGRGDDVHVVSSSVIKKGANDYKMWYGGHDGATFRIYYATSPNGLDWIKYDNITPTNSDGTFTNGKIPLGTDGKGDDVETRFPSVIKEGADYKMWYGGFDGATERVYYATEIIPSGTFFTFH